MNHTKAQNCFVPIKILEAAYLLLLILLLFRSKKQKCFKVCQAVCYAGLFFLRLQTEIFRFRASFCPVKRRNRAGSSRNECDYSRRGTQTSFPLLDCRSCVNFGLAHFSIVLLLIEEKKLIKKTPHFVQLSVFWLHN